MLARLSTHILAIAALLSPLIAIFSGVLLTPLLIVVSVFSGLTFLVQGKAIKTHSPALIGGFGVLFFYCIASALWSIEPTKSLMLGGRILLLSISGYSVIAFIRHIPDSGRTAFHKYFFAGLFLSISVIIFELITHGMLSSLIKSYKASYVFEPYMLNKSATYLVLAAWIGIALLFSQKRFVAASLLWLVILIVLLHLESASAIIAYICGTVSFGTVLLLRKTGMTLILTVICISMLIIPLSFRFIDADRMTSAFPSMPESAKHRLYIWEFTSQKAMDNPILGHGLASSRYFKIHPEDIKVPNFDPLPIHPHNNLLHIWFELGAVGVLFFTAIVVGLMLSIRKSAYPYYMQASIVAVLVSYGAVGMFSYSIWHNWWIANGFLIAAFLRKVLEMQSIKTQETDE